MQPRVKAWEYESFGKGKVQYYHMAEDPFSSLWGLRAFLVSESLRLHLY